MKKGISNAFLWGYGAPKKVADKSGSGVPAKNKWGTGNTAASRAYPPQRNLKRKAAQAKKRSSSRSTVK